MKFLRKEEKSKNLKDICQKHLKIKYHAIMLFLHAYGCFKIHNLNLVLISWFSVCFWFLLVCSWNEDSLFVWSRFFLSVCWFVPGLRTVYLFDLLFVSLFAGFFSGLRIVCLFALLFVCLFAGLLLDWEQFVCLLAGLFLDWG